MLIARRFFPFAALAISLLIVGIVVGIMPDGRLEPESSQAWNQRPSALPSPDEPSRIAAAGFGTLDDISKSIIASQDPRDILVLDLSYDDSWVANVPEFIGGYKVIHITTPKSFACGNTPVISFQATQESSEEYLAAPLVLALVESGLYSIPGVPPVNMSFSGGEPGDPEELAEQDREWNEASLREGCARSAAITE